MSNSQYGVSNSSSNPPTVNSAPFSSNTNQPPNSLPLLPNTCTMDPPAAGPATEMYAHSSSHAQSQTQQPRTGSPITATTGEIDRIMAKIEQDNRILAELDKTRSTIGKSPTLWF